MKSYIVRKYDLNGRWDPYYNHPKFKEIYNTLTKCPFPLSTLKKESSIIFSGTTPLSGGDAYTSQDGIPFIRSGDFSENNMIDFSDVLYLKEEIHNGKMKSSQLKKGDMLIAIVGATIGKVGIYSYDREANINQAICAVRLKELDPYYAQAFFQTNIGQMLIEHIKRPVARANINLEEIGSLLIPKADLEMQQKVVSVIQIATQKKQQKEQQAEALLQSIDDYLLGELGIQLPETKSQTIQDRMFVVNFSELSGDRLDVEYNNPHKHGAISKVLKSAKYSTALLSFLAKDIFQGVGKDETNDSTYVLLKVKNILRGNMIDYSDVEFVKSVPQNKLLLRNDIISPFIGEAVRQIKFSLFDKEEYRYTVDNNTGVIRLKESVNAQYVCEYLCSCLGKMQIERLIGGGGVPFLGSSGAKKLNIVIPPLQKQQEIVDYISSIRQQAKALQEEGKAILEQAKKEVEQMILGN